MSKARDFQDILAILVDGSRPFDAATVYGLSGLDQQQLSRLSQDWPQIPVERRRSLLQHLNEISESNFELNFQDINHIALTDPDSEVRQHAIEGLWEDESIGYMRKLVEIVQHDVSQDVRCAAITELGRFILLGEYEAISRADARLSQDTVLHILHSDEDDELRRYALEAIANCGREGVSEMIREFYSSDELPLRMSAVFAMGRTCDEDWAPQIIRELGSPTPEMQYEAARAAGHIGLDEAVPALIRLIEETDDTEILEIAIWALGEIGGEEARRALNAIITRAEADDDEEILAAAQDAYDAASMPGDFLLFDFEP